MRCVNWLSADAGPGRQRLHGRKPAARAAAIDSKNETFSRLGSREGQPGRQKTPVVRTPKKKSLEPSRRTTTRHMARPESAGFDGPGVAVTAWLMVCCLSE